MSLGIMHSESKERCHPNITTLVAPAQAHATNPVLMRSKPDVVKSFELLIIIYYRNNTVYTSPASTLPLPTDPPRSQ